MMESRNRRRISRRRKKSVVPLSNLRTSDVVRTVVDQPRRLEELLNLLQDSDRSLRGRAAATLARLAESHPGRLTRILDRLKEGILDDSAYVRWHLAYAIGEVARRFPTKARGSLPELRACLEDENEIVRFFACKALEQFASRKPKLLVELFADGNSDIPSSIARLMQIKGSKSTVGSA
jgi:HEAT repeat protein